MEKKHSVGLWVILLYPCHLGHINWNGPRTWIWHLTGQLILFRRHHPTPRLTADVEAQRHLPSDYLRWPAWWRRWRGRSRLAASSRRCATAWSIFHQFSSN
jgi:hypothetical protein